jgi:hypothetical protein
MDGACSTHGSCEHGNGHSGFIKVRNYQIELHYTGLLSSSDPTVNKY